MESGMNLPVVMYVEKVEETGEKCLHIEGSRGRNPSIDDVLSFLKRHPDISMLNMHFFPLTPEDLQHLATPGHLTSLVLLQCGIHDDEALVLVTKNHAVTQLEWDAKNEMMCHSINKQLGINHQSRIQAFYSAVILFMMHSRTIMMPREIERLITFFALSLSAMDQPLRRNHFAIKSREEVEAIPLYSLLPNVWEKKSLKIISKMQKLLNSSGRSKVLESIIGIASDVIDASEGKSSKQLLFFNKKNPSYQLELVTLCYDIKHSSALNEVQALLSKAQPESDKKEPVKGSSYKKSKS